MSKVIENGIIRDMTAEEQSAYDTERTAWNNASADRKLAEIKALRLERLQATDYLANSDMVMPDNIKTWRQQLRDLPQNNSTEEEYDTLLERDSSTKELTHSVWSKP